MIKKIILLFTSIFCLFLTGCSSKVTWEDNIKNDIKLLEDNGFVAFKTGTADDLNEYNEGINKELKQEGFDFTIEFTNLYLMLESSNVYSKYIYLFELKDKKDADEYYTSLNRENRRYKIFISNNILIYATSEKAMSLLNYEFK